MPMNITPILSPLSRHPSRFRIPGFGSIPPSFRPVILLHNVAAPPFPPSTDYGHAALILLPDSHLLKHLDSTHHLRSPCHPPTQRGVCYTPLRPPKFCAARFPSGSLPILALFSSLFCYESDHTSKSVLVRVVRCVRPVPFRYCRRIPTCFPTRLRLRINYSRYLAHVTLDPSAVY